MSTIYFDHAATTAVAPEVKKEMDPYFCENYGNASSLYELGYKSKEAINIARGNVARTIKANPKEIYLKDLPYRLEAGTPNIAGVIGFGEAIKYLNNIGMDKIHEREMKLKDYLIDKMYILKIVINDKIFHKKLLVAN